MSLTPFDNPLDRLGVNPTGMNWRNLWSATEQYYLNDVVVSPSNNASYILAGKTTLLDGGDPSTNPDWVELSLPTTGVVSVTALPNSGITVTNSTTNPVISNDGVLSLTTGVGINNVGTAQNPILANTGLVALIGGAGIQYTAGFPYPTITNTGIRTITAAPPLLVTAGPNVALSTSGIIDITIPPFSGLSTTGGQNPTITNTGVRSLIVGSGSGLQNLGTTQDQVLQNTGILSLIAGSGIVSTGGQNPIISANTYPRLSSIAFPSSFIGGFPPASSGTAPIVLGTKIANDFLNGVSDPNGSWVINLASLSFVPIVGSAFSTSTLTLSVRDTVTVGGPFTYLIPITDGGRVLFNYSSLLQSFSFQFSSVVLNITAIRAAGLRVINTLVVNNNSPTATLEECSYTDTFFATYFPDGIE